MHSDLDSILQRLANDLDAAISATPPAALPFWDPVLRDLLELGETTAADVLRQDTLSNQGVEGACTGGLLREHALAELLLRRHREWLAAHFCSMKLPEEQCDDAVQDLFTLLLYRGKLNSYDPDRGTFLPWLASVLRNLVRDTQRRQARRARRTVSLSQVGDIPAPEPPPDAQAEFADLRGYLLSHVEKLPPDQRSVMEHTIEGKTAGEIADLVSTNKSQVSQKLYKGREKMRPQMHALLTPENPPAYQVARLRLALRLESDETIRHKGIATQAVEVGSKAMLIGRRDAVNGVYPEIDVSGLSDYGFTSRQHARVQAEGDRLMVTDLTGQGMTAINDVKQPLLKDATAELRCGDRLIIGETVVFAVCVLD